jgi:predicted ribosome quality control (RQC) complex YloA/Tae2 family protein
MKRQLAALDLYTIVSEMQEIQGCFIDKIYQLSRDELLLRLRNPLTKKREQIYIKNGELLCLSDKQLVTPLKPTAFAMTLRKYLSNARIISVTQHEFDRIIRIQCSKNQIFTLIIELFSDGNIILINEENTIILPLIHQEWAHRIIKPRHEYVPPPPQKNPFNIEKEEFIRLIHDSTSDIVRTLAISLNLSGLYAEEICARAQITKNTKPLDLTEKDIEDLYVEMKQILGNIKEHKIQPVLVIKNDEPLSLLPFEFHSFTDVSYEPIDSIARGWDTFIVQTVHTKQVSKTQKQMEKLHRQLLQQQQAIQDLEEKMIRKQHHGEILYLHFQQIDQLLQETHHYLDLKDKKDLITFLSEHRFVESFDLSTQTIHIRLPDVKGIQETIIIDMRKSISENAGKAYEDSKKFKQKREGAKKAIQHTKQIIETVQKQLKKDQEIQKQEHQQPERMYWFEKYRWFLSTDGNLVIGGRDAKSNDLIVKKHLETMDRYAHADIQGAPSCIIKHKTYDDKPIDITEQAVLQGCIFSAVYSKAWKQFSEAQAYWVLPEQVSKTPRSGEFIPKGSFIIRGQRNYCKCKLEMGIGSFSLDGTEKIIGGPVEAIQQWCDRYVILRPSNDDRKQLTQRLSTLFKRSVDDINKVLPPGGCLIISLVGFQTSDQ